MTRIDAIIIHVSDTPDGRDDRAADIHRWHNERGWSGIGYHRVIPRDGTIEYGRPDYWQGAHVGGHNANTLGICLIGRTDLAGAQHDALQSEIHRLRARYPQASIRGHRDYDPSKPCPNFDVRAWCQQRGIDPK